VPVQYSYTSTPLSACTVQLYLYSPYWPYGLYRASVPVQYSYTTTHPTDPTPCTDPQCLYKGALYSTSLLDLLLPEMLQVRPLCVKLPDGLYIANLCSVCPHGRSLNSDHKQNCNKWKCSIKLTVCTVRLSYKVPFSTCGSQLCSAVAQYTQLISVWTEMSSALFWRTTK